MSVDVTEALDWVTFSDDGDLACLGRYGFPCGLEAVAVGIWRRSCECRPARTPFCVSHRDSVLASLHETWEHSHGRFTCAFCGGKNWLLRVEPVR